MTGIAETASVPQITLASAAGAAAELRETLGTAGVLVVVHEDCPTSALALRRIASADPAGHLAVALFEDEVDEAARVARRTRFAGPVLSEPAPYPVSRALGVE